MEANIEGTRISLADDVFVGGGEMGALMRSMDWSATGVGPVEQWPQSLRTAVSICLASRFPILIWWGPELVMLYNDAYRTILGTTKHPKAMGQRGRECWPEIWDVIGPMLEGVIQRAEATWSEDQLLLLDRNGYVEECYFTFSYSPIRDESGGVGGVFTAVTETTDKVLSERRLRTLRELAADASEARTTQAVYDLTAEALASNATDIPFALFYLLEDDGARLRLVSRTGLALDGMGEDAFTNLELGDDGLLERVARSGQPQVISDLALWAKALTGDPITGALPHEAVAISVAQSGQERPYGILVAGISPLRTLDDSYRSFFALIAGQIASAIADAHANEDERRRAEALAELDRAKTVFFSNVSHEFRTPLTLLLGPTEDALADTNEPLTPHQRARLDIIQRNGLRLYRLVNTLLDFTRIEEGRIQAVYEPVDLCAYTADLASAFRSAIERTGLRFTVTCLPLTERVYVDREIWEKIVFNLLSNALKFTFEGEIIVRLREDGERVTLEVSDTGIGIPAAELPRLFERFHRVQGARARTQEGTGIGLALVQNLARLLGGSVGVTSVEGKGTTFSVTVPLGTAHLAVERIGAERTLASTAFGAAPYVMEAQRWLAGSAKDADDTTVVGLGVDGAEGAAGRIGEADTDEGTTRARILLADDNADMRDYVTRLLGERWEVEAVADGREAMAAIQRRKPDLVLSDVMMPHMNGFEFLRALRTDERTRDIPFILLSARAGEESSVEGLNAGADDYLIKPFSARELLARVTSHVELARMRKQMIEHERRLLEEVAAQASQLNAVYSAIPDLICVYDAEGNIVRVNEATDSALAITMRPDYYAHPTQERIALADIRDERGAPLAPEHFPAQRVIRAATHVDSETGDIRLRAFDGREIVLNWSGAPIRDAEGRIIGAVCVYRDVTERRGMEQVITEQKWRFDALLAASPDHIFLLDPAGRFMYVNPAAATVIVTAGGADPHDILSHTARELGLPDDFIAEFEAQQAKARAGEVAVAETVFPTPQGARSFEYVLSPLYRRDGTLEAVVGLTRDIEERKQQEQRTQAALQALLDMAEALVQPMVEGDASAGHGLLTIQATARQLCALSRAVLGCSQVSLQTIDERMLAIQPLAVVGLSPEQERQWWAEVPLAKVQDYLDASQSGRLLAGETIQVDIMEAPPVDRDYYGFVKPLVVPLHLDAHVMGVLMVDYGTAEHQYTAEEIALAQAVGKLAALAIERERLLGERAEAGANMLALRETNRRMDEFLGIAGHELRTPLTSLKANVQMLTRRVRSLVERPQGADADAAIVETLGPTIKLLTRMDQQTDRLTRLVNDLLDVSRIQSGKLELRFEELDLGAIIRESAQEQQQSWPTRDIRLELPAAPIKVSADTDRVGQVITNYLTNALKYSSPDAPVMVSLTTDGHTASVRVRDQGPGLPPFEQTLIWEQFHRAPGIAEQSGSGIGLGLGLHISKTLIERQGGQVGVESTVGQGSTFWFTLPLAS